MTRTHRDRLLFVCALVVVLDALGTASVFRESGPGAAVAVFTFSLIPAALLVGVVAYIWRGNDKRAISEMTRRE